MSNIPPVKLTLFGGGPKYRSNYQLTTLGRTKAEQINISGSRGTVVMTLENIGPCTLSEIANETRMTPTHVKEVMQILIRDGWANKMTGEG